MRCEIDDTCTVTAEDTILYILDIIHLQRKAHAALSVVGEDYFKWGEDTPDYINNTRPAGKATDDEMELLRRMPRIDTLVDCAHDYIARMGVMLDTLCKAECERC